jgi:hypothetical protein
LDDPKKEKKVKKKYSKRKKKVNNWTRKAPGRPGDQNTRLVRGR